MKRRVFALLLTLSLALGLVTPALAAESAATIRLSKTSGTVSVSKSSGKSLTLMSNMRLYNGYHVTTKAGSYAWLNLDDTKLVKVDVSSEIEVRKSGKNLEVNICSGNVFFNVSEKLEEDESLNISTSTMIVGIRGTAGYVQVVDRWTTEITILEGSTRCTVTDPVTGQTKTQTISGGQTATCVVHPQEQAGEKCEIIKASEPQGVEEIPGFVLTDVVRDLDLCDRIEENTGTDILEELAAVVGGDPSGRSGDGNAASPEILGEVDRRESTEAAQSQQAQEAAEAQVENTVAAADKALTPEEAPSVPSEPPEPSEPSVPPEPSEPSGPVTVTRTMPVTAAELQTALDGADVVNLQPESDAAGSTLNIADDEALTVAAGKTLNLESGVDMQVYSAGTLAVNGTLSANSVTNGGSITVNSANTLHVTGDFTNDGILTVTATGRVVVDGAFNSTGTLDLTKGAQVLAKNGFGYFTPPAGWFSFGMATYNGAQYPCMKYTPPCTITFDPNGGTLTGDSTAVTEGGMLASLPAAPTRSANTGGTAKYTFNGWFTAADGGTKVDATAVFTADTTVYAHWTIAGWDWALEGGKLTIFGTGTMTNFTSATPSPWNSDRASITSVTIESGITSVGHFTFDGCTKLTGVTIPASVTSIGAGAFANCTGLTTVTIPAGVETVAANAFVDCTALKKITFGGTRLEWDAFDYDAPDGVIVTCSDGVPAAYTVTFDPNGGTLSGNSTAVTSAVGTLALMPTANDFTTTRQPTTSGTATYTFAGWFTAAEGGDPVTTATVFTANTTVYAHWTISGWDWELSADKTALRIFGNGIMTNFASATSQPWNSDLALITGVTIESGITSVGDYAFYNCANLATVTLPEGLTAINSYAFDGCTALTGITIPGQVTSIGRSAFESSGLTELSLPDSVTTLGMYSFSSCKNLTSAYLGCVTTIVEMAFDGCTSLKSVTFSDDSTLSRIPTSAFVGAALTEITLPASVNQISGAAFSKCALLKTVRIPTKEDIAMESDPFDGCTSLTDIYYGGTKSQWNNQYNHGGTAVSNPNIHCSDGILRIYTVTFDPCGGTFSGDTSRSTRLWGTLASLPTAPTRTHNTDGTATYTFKGWFTAADGGTEITQDTVFTADTTVYAQWTINGWDWTLKDGKLTIFGTGDMSYFGIGNTPWIDSASTITSVIVEDGITGVGGHAFGSCTSLTDVTIPDSVTHIDGSAFSACANLTGITLPAKLTSIGQYAFYDCDNLTTVTIPTGVTSIEEYTFYGCTNLSNVEIPNSVTSIGHSAFNGCASLTGITIPTSVTSIGVDAFLSCTSLTDITIPAGVTSIRATAFWNCTSLTTVEIPASVTAIAADAFERCTALKDIKFGGTRLAWDAFAYDAPANVTVTCSDGVAAAHTVTFDSNGGTLSGADTTVTNVVGKLTSLPTPTRTAKTDGTATYAFDGWFTAADDSGKEITKDTVFTDDTRVYAHWTMSDTGWDWELSADKTALRIFGKGDMKDFGGNSPSWNSDRVSITSVTIDSGITKVGQGAFIGFTNLTTITLPQSITSIGSYAFQDCTALKSVTFSGTPKFTNTGLGMYAFVRCVALTSFTVPDGVTEVQGGTFEGCAALTTVKIPASVTSVATDAFSGCTQQITFTYDGTSSEWTNLMGAVTVPDNSIVTCSDGSGGYTSADGWTYVGSPPTP